MVLKFDSHYQNAARETGMKEKDIKRCMEAVMNSMVWSTRRYGSSNLAGMFTFKLARRSNKKTGKWKNPVTGKEHVLPAKPPSKTVLVRPTDKMVQMINDCTAAPAGPAAAQVQPSD